MTATNIGYLVQFCFIIGAAFFVMGLHLMNSPATARSGNRLSAAGMIVAVSAQLVNATQGHAGPGNWAIIIVGLALGGGLGLRMARTVAMTSMPQLVSLFNAVGGGAAGLLALNDFADGTAVKFVGEETFRLCQQYVDEMVLVDTDAICAAIKDVFEDTRSILEPAGALAVAGVKAWCERHRVRDRTLVAIACGAAGSKAALVTAFTVAPATEVTLSTPLPTTKRTTPATGCESAEITRKLSVYVPSPSPDFSATAIVVPSPSG